MSASDFAVLSGVDARCGCYCVCVDCGWCSCPGCTGGEEEMAKEFNIRTNLVLNNKLGPEAGTEFDIVSGP